MNRAFWIRTAAAIPLTLALSGKAFAQQVVRVGDALGDPYAEGFYAAEGGFFKKHGLNVDFQVFTSGTPIAQGVVTGNLEIGIMTPLAVANAVTRGVNLVMIAPGGVNSVRAPGGYLIVTPTSPFTTAKDFEGKAIALASLRTLHELMIRSWFDKNGLDQGRLSFLELTFGEMGPAIERGTVAGAVQVEPLASGLISAGRARVIAGPGSAIAEEILGGAWFCTREYAEKNPAIVRRFATMMTEVARWANTHRREAGDIQARAGKLDPEAVRGMNRVTYAETFRVAQIQPLLDAALKFGILTRRVPAAEIIFS